MNAATSFQPQTPMLLKSRQDLEQEIQQRVATERQRLEEQARRKSPHFHRPVERPFTAAECRSYNTRTDSWPSAAGRS